MLLRAPDLTARLTRGFERVGRAASDHTPVVKRAVAGATAFTLVVALAVLLWPGPATVHVSAHFPRTIGLYAGSDVRVLGVPIGEVTEVVPEGQSVRVELEFSSDYQVPAEAKAAVVAPSVVSDRYVQLTPVYRGGPVMQDAADIPLDRSATPVELDRIFGSLNDLNVALGPKGANSKGALSRLLEVGAANLDGQGRKLNGTVGDLSQAVTTLSDGRQDLFGTVRNLQVFTTALANSDGAVRRFNTDLASVADQLSGEREELAAALKNLAVALSEVSTFVKDNREALKSNVDGLTKVSTTLVHQRAALAETLDAAPVALSNLNLAYNPSSGTLDTRNNADQFHNPKQFLCELFEDNKVPKAARLCSVVRKLSDGDLDGLLSQLPLGALGGVGGGVGRGGGGARGGPAPGSRDLTLGGILRGGS